MQSNQLIKFKFKFNAIVQIVTIIPIQIQNQHQKIQQETQDCNQVLKL